jgi:hypothetical protein
VGNFCKDTIEIHTQNMVLLLSSWLSILSSHFNKMPKGVIMADLASSIDQLSIAVKVLLQKWEDTHPLWNDPVSQSFEKNYLALLEAHTQSTLNEMQKLAQVIAEAKRQVR